MNCQGHAWRFKGELFPFSQPLFALGGGFTGWLFVFLDDCEAFGLNEIVLVCVKRCYIHSPDTLLNHNKDVPFIVRRRGGGLWQSILVVWCRGSVNVLWVTRPDTGPGSFC